MFCKGNHRASECQVVTNIDEREEAVNVSLFTVRHVFVGFVEGEESGIRNAKCGIRNPFPFVICRKSFRIYNIFLFLFF